MEDGIEEKIVKEGVIEDESSSFSISGLLDVLIYNPINATLLLVILFLIYQLFGSRKEKSKPVPPTPQVLPRLKKQDMTSQQLRQYDGTNEEHLKRVCIAINGKIFDVTKGKRYYGPGGPYSAFAGRDASRGFAKFEVEASDLDYDDLSDLTTMEMESVREWEMQFHEKYEYVGRLLKPGEEPTDYSDEEDTSQEQNSPDNKKDLSQDDGPKVTSNDHADEKVFQDAAETSKNVRNRAVDSNVESSEKGNDASSEIIASGEPAKNPSDKKSE